MKTFDGRNEYDNSFSNDGEFFDKAICYIEQNFHKEQCNVLKLAIDIGVSRSTLYREFIKKTGMSPLSYLKKYRLKKAAEMLKEDASIAVSAVAFSCGYQNQYYFSKDFKKAMGVSPSEFRKEHFDWKNIYNIYKVSLFNGM